MKVTIIDYGLSNLLSVRRAFERAGAKVEITDKPERALDASMLVLPGVGAFADGMAGLKSRGLALPIREKVRGGTPLLGICLGMQLLFDGSDEFGVSDGLSLIAGRVERIPELDTGCRRQTVPHIGWSELMPYEKNGFDGTALRSVPKGGEVYFVHSYEAKPDDPESAVAYCEYGGRKICAAAKNEAGNVLGVQFHPEKSGELGIEIIRDFLRGV